MSLRQHTSWSRQATRDKQARNLEVPRENNRSYPGQGPTSRPGPVWPSAPGSLEGWPRLVSTTRRVTRGATHCNPIKTKIFMLILDKRVL